MLRGGALNMKGTFWLDPKIVCGVPSTEDGVTGLISS